MSLPVRSTRSYRGRSWETGPVSVIVTNQGLSSPPQTVQIAQYSPSLFEFQGHAIAINLDGTLAAPTNSIAGLTTHPATPGDTLILLASGLGPVNPPPVTGHNSLDTIRIAGTPTVVLLGRTSVPVTFAGLSPQFVGVYQINVTVPFGVAPASSVPLQIQGDDTGPAETTIAIGAGWPQWNQNSQHARSISVPGQSMTRILADVIYDPPDEKAANGGELVAHYQVPLIDGNDLYTEYKSGTYTTGSYASQIWGESKFTWQNGQFVRQWSYASGWKTPGSAADFWEPVFHAALARDSVFVPGAHGSIIQLDKATGAAISRIAPFGTDPNTWQTGRLRWTARAICITARFR